MKEMCSLLILFGILFVFVECQLKIVVIKEGDKADQTLHSRYIKAALQFVQKSLIVPDLSYDEIKIESNDVDTVTDQVCALINNGTAFFISLSQTPTVVASAKSLSLATSVPMVQIQNWPWKYVSKSNISNVESNYANFISPKAVFANVLSALVKNIDLSGDVAVLYDEIYNSSYEARNMSIFTNLHLNPQFMPMQTDQILIHNQLEFIKYKEIFNVFLLTTTTNAQKFLQYAQGYDNSWYIITLDPNPYLCEVCYVSNVLWVRPEMNMSFTEFQDFQDEMINPTTINAADVLLPHDKLMLSFYLDLATLVYYTVINLNLTLPSFPSFTCSMDMTRTTVPAVQYGSVGTTGIRYDGTYTTDIEYTTEVEFNSTTTFKYIDYSTITTRRPASISTPVPPTVQVPVTENVESIQFMGSFGQYRKDANGNYFQDITVKIGNIRDVGDQSGRIIKTVAKWSVISGLEEIQSPLFQDFSTSKEFTVAVALQSPFVETFVDTNGKTKFRGYCIDMMDRLASDIGFTYTVYPVADNKYGILSSRGDWNGLIREVVYGDADIALGTLRISSDKENYVDLTVPYYELVGNLIIMLNQPTTNSYFEFMTVLTTNVWLCILGAFFVTSFVLYVFDRISPYGKHETKKFTYSQCMWYCLTSLIPQGGPAAPKNTSCKVVAATWWLFGFIIISAYTANLAASLTLTRIQSTINSLDDLSAQFAYRYGAVRGSETEAYLKRMMDIEQRFYNIWKLENMTLTMSPNDRASLAIWDYSVSDKYTNMWKFITDDNFAYLPTSLEQALEWVLASNSTNGFAYIGEGSEIRNIKMTDCRFSIVGDEFNKQPYGIAVQQKSPMKDLLSKQIMILIRSGWLPGLKDTWWTNNSKAVTCANRDSGTANKGISVMNIFGVFLVIGVLLIICIITLVIEFCYYEEKICVQKYHEHHPDLNHPHHQHSYEDELKHGHGIDESKYSNNFDIQKVEPQKLSYVIKH